MKRKTLEKIINVLFTVFTKTSYEGAEYIPAQGPVIVTTNHMSRLDIPALLLNPIRREIIALVADKYKSDPLFSFIVNSSGCIWIDRSKADFTAFAAAFKALREGTALGIAPEGTRSQTSVLLEGKPGTALIATKGNYPIIPAAIIGTETSMYEIRHLRRARILVRFGPPYYLAPIDRDNREQTLKQYADEMMCRIAVMMPEKYHGFYAGHPRLKELQANPPV